MCRYMGINAFGTDNFLRSTIRSRLTTIRRDDQLIEREGIDELSTSELQAACQSRGIRTGGISPARLREELATWIRLHLHNRVSGVLLVLARAFQFDRTPGEGEDGKTAIIKSLENVLSSLPDNLVRILCLIRLTLDLPIIYSSTKRNLKLTQTKLATNRSLRFCNSKKNLSRTRRSKNRRRRMLVVLVAKRKPD